MANPFTTTKAPVGLDGFSPASLAALQASAAAASDNAAYIAEAGEAIVYTPNGSTSTPGAALSFMAVVDRHPAQVVTEDGKVLADDVQVTFQNDSAAGVTAVNVGRDTVTVAGRFGGAPVPHVVTEVVYGDKGLWTVKVR